MEGSIQQPDFTLVARNLRETADHLERCENLPAVDGGARLIQVMENMSERLIERMNSLEQKTRRGFIELDQKFTEKFNELDRKFTEKFNELDRKVTDLDQKVTDLDRKVTFSHKNFAAQMLNSNIVHDSSNSLSPLYNVQTGEEVADCPATLGDLNQLSSQAAGDLLARLGEPVPRTLDQRKRQLRHAFGVGRTID